MTSLLDTLCVRALLLHRESKSPYLCEFHGCFFVLCLMTYTYSYDVDMPMIHRVRRIRINCTLGILFIVPFEDLLVRTVDVNEWCCKLQYIGCSILEVMI